MMMRSCRHATHEGQALWNEIKGTQDMRQKPETEIAITGHERMVMVRRMVRCT